MRTLDDRVDRLVDARVNAERQAVAGRVDRVDEVLLRSRAGSAAGAAPARTPRASARRCESISISVGGMKLPCGRIASARAAAGTPAGPVRASPRYGPRCSPAPPRRSPAPCRSPADPACRPASSRIAPSSIGTMRSAISSWTQSTRSAEQRCPALSKADAITSATTCSGSAEESTIIAFCPPVSAISGIGRPRSSSRPARLRCSSRATSVEPVNITPRTRASATSAAPTTSPRPGRNCSASARHAGLMQQGHRLGRDQRRLLGGLREHAVAGRERRGHLPGEDRQRKIPRTDADDRPQRREGRHLRARHAPVPRSSAGSRPPRAPRRRVGAGLAGLAHDEPDQRRHLRFQRVGRTLQRRGTLRRRHATASALPRRRPRPSPRRHPPAFASMTVPTRSRRSAGLATAASSGVRFADARLRASARRASRRAALACSAVVSSASCCFIRQGRGRASCAAPRRTAAAAARSPDAAGRSRRRHAPAAPRPRPDRPPVRRSAPPRRRCG